jgi:uncharacterized damage-inducible protein DinB
LNKGHLIVATHDMTLLFLIDQAFNRKAWHGTNLRASIRGLTLEQALWRPARGRHNIWEIVVHAAYWKYAVRRRLLGQKRGTFASRGNNWFVRSEKQGEDLWKADVALLESEHRKLRDAVMTSSPDTLIRASAGSKTTPLVLITGIASHDLYHAGQIQIIKRLAKGAR